MPEAKICGISETAHVQDAIKGGAKFVGFVFYPPSPRAVSTERAAVLAAEVPSSVKKVGLFVDPSDEQIASVLEKVSLDLIQLHGQESPARVKEIKERFALPVIKAIKVRLESDLAQADEFDGLADILLFDAKPPSDDPDALPGGNGVPFDWRLLADADFSSPWMLSGGLNPDNLTTAIATTHAAMVDVSSGVESEPGKKDSKRIKAFLDACRAL